MLNIIWELDYMRKRYWRIRWDRFDLIGGCRFGLHSDFNWLNKILGL